MSLLTEASKIHSSSTVVILLFSIYIYSYNYYVTDDKGICDTTNFTAKKANIILINDKLAILDNDYFTKISVDPTNHHGCQQPNVPVININIDSEIYGTGFIFDMTSNRPLAAKDLQEIILNEYSKKVNPLITINVPAIDDALINDAITVTQLAVMTMKRCQHEYSHHHQDNANSNVMACNPISVFNSRLRYRIHKSASG